MNSAAIFGGLSARKAAKKIKNELLEEFLKNSEKFLKKISERVREKISPLSDISEHIPGSEELELNLIYK